MTWKDEGEVKRQKWAEGSYLGLRCPLINSYSQLLSRAVRSRDVVKNVQTQEVPAGKAGRELLLLGGCHLLRPTELVRIASGDT